MTHPSQFIRALVVCGLAFWTVQPQAFATLLRIGTFRPLIRVTHLTRAVDPYRGVRAPQIVKHRWFSTDSQQCNDLRLAMLQLKIQNLKLRNPEDGILAENILNQAIREQRSQLRSPRMLLNTRVLRDESQPNLSNVFQALTSPQWMKDQFPQEKKIWAAREWFQRQYNLTHESEGFSERTLMRVNHLIIGALDSSETSKFYTNYFGFQEETSFVDTGTGKEGKVLAISNLTSSSDPLKYTQNTLQLLIVPFDQARLPNPQHLALEVDKKQFETIYDHIVSDGLKIRAKPSLTCDEEGMGQVESGGFKYRNFYVLDPGGVNIEVMTKFVTE